MSTLMSKADGNRKERKMSKTIKKLEEVKEESGSSGYKSESGSTKAGGATPAQSYAEPEPAQAVSIPSSVNIPSTPQAEPVKPTSNTGSSKAVSDSASVIDAGKSAMETIQGGLDDLYGKQGSVLDSILSYQIPEFSSEWDPLTREAVNNLINMKYSDWLTTEDYKALEDRYQYLGNRAMQDTLGQVSARTGGLASSYAGSASQQAYNDYMTQLQDVAMNMYQQERSNQMQNAEMLASMSDRDYQRYTENIALEMQKMGYDLDAIGQAINALDSERNYQFQKEQFDYQKYRDDVADSQWERTFDYQKVRDAIGDEQWAKEFGFSQDQFEWTKYMDQENLGLATKQFERSIFESDRDYEYNTGNDAYDRTLEMCMYTGDFSAMGKLSGDYKWSKAQINKANKMFKLYLNSGSSGGSGGRRGSGRYRRSGRSGSSNTTDIQKSGEEQAIATQSTNDGANVLAVGLSLLSKYTPEQMADWAEANVINNPYLNESQKENILLELGLIDEEPSTSTNSNGIIDKGGKTKYTM